MKAKKIKFSSLFILLFLFSSLPVLLSLVQTAKYYWTRAWEQPANIIVDVSVSEGTITPLWKMLAQGGEEKSPFSNVLGEITFLKPIYLRIDHLYDFYDVVKKENGQLVFDFTQLDKIVEEILSTGALPFFSLSYMPPVIAQDGEITNPPSDWEDWATVVQKTIQYYSGQAERNLSNVVYEVWNEPDLFGGWKLGGKKDYRQLYRYAVIGAGRTQKTNPFKIGGPATTALYPNWLNGFLDFVVQNNLRLDFYSWHRYNSNPSIFSQDLDQLSLPIWEKTGNAVEKYLTEWGSDSENSFWHDRDFDAAHLVSVIRQLIGRADQAYIFEIKDGLDPLGKKYWGRWGLLTHEGAGKPEKKPKYRALELLNKMPYQRIQLTGEGSWVSGFATKDEGVVKVILANLDPKDQHAELVPLTINGLNDGAYNYQEFPLSGRQSSHDEIVLEGSLKKIIEMPPNSVVLIELTKL